MPSERLARPVGRPQRQPEEVERETQGSEGGNEMEWQFIVAMVVIIPVILLPVAFVWYLNLGGLYVAVREARRRRASRHEGRVATDRVS